MICALELVGRDSNTVKDENDHLFPEQNHKTEEDRGQGAAHLVGRLTGDETV